MTDFSIPDEPDPQTKEDAYKLAMLAAQFDRLKDGRLDFDSAYNAWKHSIKYVQNQYFGKTKPNLLFSSFDFKIYPLSEGLKRMEIVPSNWRNTFLKKFDRLKIPKKDAAEMLNFWEEFGIPDFHVEQFRNEKAAPLPDLDD
jgi:hypothetical protein